MAKIDNSAYNYFLQAYGDKLSGTRFDSHKREDLEKIYNRIVRKNRSTPVYKITFDGDVKNFAIDLKEQSRSTLNLVSSITEDSDDIESVFYKKIATSSNEDAVKINYIGSDDADGRTAFTVGVDSLALPQVNTGNYLPIKAMISRKARILSTYRHRSSPMNLNSMSHTVTRTGKSSQRLPDL